jgi:hypothetical protein
LFLHFALSLRKLDLASIDWTRHLLRAFIISYAYAHAINAYAFNNIGYITIIKGTTQRHTIEQNKIESKRLFDQKLYFKTAAISVIRGH